MVENTSISWADDTFSPWIGCTKVSPACDGCYAEHLMDTRMHRVNWGPHGERVRTAPANWKKPLKWDREQAAAVQAWRTNPFALAETPKPSRFVFCASLADVFDNAVPPEWRRDLFELIRATPHLTWLLLTKRPQNITRLFFETLHEDQHPDWVVHPHQLWPRNAAIGCTVVTQAEADRDIPKLLAAKAALKPAFAFLSMEPLMEAVDISEWLFGRVAPCAACPKDEDCECGWMGRHKLPGEVGLDWVITGGETDQGKHKARPSHADWFRSLRDQCAAAEVPFHHKQNGEWLTLKAGYPHRTDPLTGSAVINVDGRQFKEDAIRIWAGDFIVKVGKDTAGRLLDGVTHDARPDPEAIIQGGRHAT